MLILFKIKTFDQWLKNTGGLRLGDQNEALNFRFITCGDWDLIKMLPGQCKTFNLPYPNYFREWINLKKAYCEHTHHFPRGMTTMLEQLSNHIYKFLNINRVNSILTNLIYNIFYICFKI